MQLLVQSGGHFGFFFFETYLPVKEKSLCESLVFSDPISSSHILLETLATSQGREKEKREIPYARSQVIQNVTKLWTSRTPGSNQCRELYWLLHDQIGLCGMSLFRHFDWKGSSATMDHFLGHEVIPSCSR